VRERQPSQQVQLGRLIPRSFRKSGGFIPVCGIECLLDRGQARVLGTAILGETWSRKKNQAE
jgi:hypothetical protein